MKTLTLSDNRLCRQNLKPFLRVVCFPFHVNTCYNFNIYSHALLNMFISIFATFFSACLPEEIGNLRKLETLLLSNNGLSTLPTNCSNLRSLKVISLSHNKFTTFPTQLGGLKNLDSVDCSQNRITAIPDHVKDVHAIEINFNQNQVLNF